MAVSEKLKKAHDEFYTKKIQERKNSFLETVNEIKKLKDANDSKGYKSGKLYYDVLKKYNLQNFINVDDELYLAYNLVTKKGDFTLEDCFNEIYDKCCNYFTLEQIQYELSLKFNSYLARKSKREGKGIPVESFKERAFDKDFQGNLNDFEKLLIEENLKAFLTDTLENSFENYDLIISKKEELRNRLKASL